MPSGVGVQVPRGVPMFLITEGTDTLVVQQSRKLPHRKGTGVRFPAPPPSSSASVPGRAGGFQTHRMGFESSLARQLRKRRVIRYPTAPLMRGRNRHERSNRSASAKLGWQVRYRLAAPVCRTGSPSETFGVKLPGHPPKYARVAERQMRGAQDARLLVVRLHSRAPVFSLRR